MKKMRTQKKIIENTTANENSNQALNVNSDKQIIKVEKSTIKLSKNKIKWIKKGHCNCSTYLHYGWALASSYLPMTTSLRLPPLVLVLPFAPTSFSHYLSLKTTRTKKKLMTIEMRKWGFYDTCSDVYKLRSWLGILQLHRRANWVNNMSYVC